MNTVAARGQSSPGLTAWCTIALAVAACLGTLGGMGPWLQWDRVLIESGQGWRLLTGHWMHWTADHLFWDVAAFGVLGWICERMHRGATMATIVGSAIAISIGVLLLQPEVMEYRGLSGIDSALFTLAAVMLGRTFLRERRWAMVGATGGMLLLFGVKLIYEWMTGDLWFVQTQQEAFTPLPIVHAIGGGVGVLLGVEKSPITMAQRVRSRKTSKVQGPRPTQRLPLSNAECPMTNVQ